MQMLQVIDQAKNYASLCCSAWSLDNKITHSTCPVYQVFEKFKAAGSCCALYSTKTNDFSI